MWALITFAIKTLYELSGIPGWFKEREEIAEGRQDQQMADLQATQKDEDLQHAEEDKVFLMSGASLRNSMRKWTKPKE